MEIKIPEVGESVVEALVANWLKGNGEVVEKDEPICEIETDKVTMELNAPVTGRLSILVGSGATVRIGSVIAEIDADITESAEPEVVAVPGAAGHVSPAERKAAREKTAKTSKTREDSAVVKKESVTEAEDEQASLFPSAVRSEEPVSYAPERTKPKPDNGRVSRQPMTPIRRRIAERLAEARRQTAMLTTFNEADMGRIKELRKKHGDAFSRRHGVRLGFMPFFVKACVEALQEFPAVNARIDGDDIVYHHYYDIGIAVSGEKGLVVPVLRDADRLHFAELEKGIEDFVSRVKENKLNLADLEGGTFTISNGGVFGSLLSTPIINPPQSAVLGMHAVQDRPVARNGKVVIRPMMYLALTYDHRIIDGREAVQFLRKVIEYIEEPEEMLLEG